MAMQDIGVSIVGKITEKFIDPIMRQFQYLFCYRSNVETLRNGIKKLELTKTEVQRSVDAARNNGEEIKPIVTDWLRQADGLEKEADTIFEGMENVKVNCFKIVRLPNLKSRYLIGRHAAKRGNDAEKHLRERRFDEVGYLPPLGKMPFSESTPSFEESLITRMSMKREVIEALKQDKRSLLAICGMAGVGKTFLLEQIADQVKSEKLFDGVAFATISQNPDMRNIQNQLAEQLRMKLKSEHSGRARAEQIYTRLINSDKRNLVMLDDIWEEVDLRSLGIPIRSGKCKSLTVVLTSRFSHVCRNMEAEIFEVNALPKEEAWHLFKEVAGISDDSALSDVAKQVAEECKGLPLAIVVVARAFRTNYTTPESWKLALGQLKKYTMRDLERVQDLVFSRIEWSYDRLKSVEAKSLLLFCSLFPEDYSIPVECLVRYGKGLKMFQDRETLGDMRYRVDQSISDLKSCYLLLTDGGKEDHVKLHDVVRDVCLKIASEGEHVFLVRNVGGKEGHPQPDSFGRYTAVSLTWKGNSNGPFPLGEECPKLRLLRLVFQSGKMISLSPDSFAGMEDLRVMEFNKLQIEFSPSDPGQMLMSLRTLCLDYCELGIGTSSMIGYMTQLEILSFFESRLRDNQFPTEIAQLSNLKVLDLRVESSRHPLSLGILSSLKKLEELYMGFHRPLRLGRNAEEERGCIKEITSLACLECLQINLHGIDDLLLLLREFPVERLSRFNISCKQTQTKNGGDYQFRRNFKLYLPDEKDSELALCPAVTSIIRRTENLILDLGFLFRSGNFVNDLDESGFVNLKRLRLKSGSWECLIDSTTNLAPRHVFENLVFMELTSGKLEEICYGNLPPRCFSQLQEMKLLRMNFIEYLWKGPIEPPSLCNLRGIEVSNCQRITTLFSQSVLKCLVKLQKIVVYSCENLESIVMREENMKDQVLELPQLKVVTLKYTGLEGFGCEGDTYSRAFLNQVSLPRLEMLDLTSPGYRPEQFVGGEMLRGSLENLRSLVLSSCYFIRCIAKADGVALLENLQSFSMGDCPSMELLFDLEGLKVPIPSKKELEILPNLKSLELRGLTRLTHIWRNYPKGIRVFQNLRILQVEGCSLPCLFYPPCVADMLVSLEKLKVGLCPAMYGVIAGENEETSQEDHDGGEKREISLGRTNKEFLFPKLSSLSFVNLQNLQSFSGGHHEDCEFKFPSLTQLEIMRCPELKNLCPGKLDAPLLKKVKVEENDANIPLDLMVDIS
ncbi:disease resistance protein At4g27190-like [Coffea eugenioides]|uniref:disease resistance protein At4g27190-like n=1 Tax=Coffea eugenioides TaxID=49369 RepID=UPI000F60FE33|nr:disease resistance protein At4g27190-like [Coffea eugenioides]